MTFSTVIAFSGSVILVIRGERRKPSIHKNGYFVEHFEFLQESGFSSLKVDACEESIILRHSKNSSHTNCFCFFPLLHPTSYLTIIF
jgi:hypothetical protein